MDVKGQADGREPNGPQGPTGCGADNRELVGQRENATWSYPNDATLGFLVLRHESAWVPLSTQVLWVEVAKNLRLHHGTKVLGPPTVRKCLGNVLRLKRLGRGFVAGVTRQNNRTEANGLTSYMTDRICNGWPGL